MSKPRRAHGAERCTVRNPGPHGARCRYQAGHDPVDDGVNGHAPELDDVTKADGSPVDFAPVGPIELRAALREERAARLKAQAERDEMQAGGRKAIETCATVIVERDEALALLSRVREAWAKRLRARESMVRWQTDIQREQAARDESTATADLSRLLGEGAP